MPFLYQVEIIGHAVSSCEFEVCSAEQICSSLKFTYVLKLKMKLRVKGTIDNAIAFNHNKPFLLCLWIGARAHWNEQMKICNELFCNWVQKRYVPQLIFVGEREIPLAIVVDVLCGSTENFYVDY